MELIFSVEALAGLLNKTPGEITEALKESDQNSRDSWLKTLVDSQKSEAVSTAVQAAKTRYHDEGYGKGKRETLTSAEKKIREQYEVDGATIDELIEKVSEKARVSSESQPGDVKNSPVFIEMETGYRDRIKKLTEDLENEQSNRSRDKVMAKIEQSIEPKLREMKFALPDDAAKRLTWIKVITNSLENDDTKLALNADGNISVLGSDGKAKFDDVAMKDVTFDDLLNQTAGKYLSIDSSDGKEGTGNQNAQGSGDSGFDFSHIKTTDDYLSEMRKMDVDKDGDKMKALEEYHEKSVEGVAA